MGYSRSRRAWCRILSIFRVSKRMFAEHQVRIYLTLRLRFRLRLGLASATRRYTFQNASAARKDRGYEVLRETTYQPRTSEDQKNLFR
ncbi:hypothetical protein IG631_21245 [Alternaria alternata]|nr:hypothetical protein IG631_21245 [Alternaria alternata]